MAFCSVRVMRCWPMTSSKVWGRQRRETEIWDTAVTSGKVNHSLIRQESGAACQKPDGVMPEFPPFALIYYAGSALAAIWVPVDGRTRLAHRPALEVLGLGNRDHAGPPGRPADVHAGRPRTRPVGAMGAGGEDRHRHLLR